MVCRMSRISSSSFVTCCTQVIIVANQALVPSPPKVSNQTRITAHTYNKIGIDCIDVLSKKLCTFMTTHGRIEFFVSLNLLGILHVLVKNKLIILLKCENNNHTGLVGKNKLVIDRLTVLPTRRTGHYNQDKNQELSQKSTKKLKRRGKFKLVCQKWTNCQL